MPLTNGPQFRYALAQGAGLLAPQRLRYEPTGWDAVGVSLHRDPKSHGPTADYAAQLGFVKDGKQYLTRAYQAAGVEADVRCVIEQLDPNAFTWLPYYEGRVDYTSAEFTDTAVRVNLEQQSWLQKFLNRSSVQVDLFGTQSVGGALGPAAAQQTVRLHSRAILERYAGQQKAASSEFSPGLMFGKDDDASHELLLYFGFDTTDFNELDLGTFGGGFVAGAEADAVPLHRMPGDGELTLDFALAYHVHAERTTGFFFRKFRRVDVKYRLKVTGSVSETIDLLPPVENEVDSLYDAVVRIGRTQRTWQLKKDDAVYLYAAYFVHELDGTNLDQYQAQLTGELLQGSYLRLTTVTTTEPTTTRGLLFYEACQRVVEALSDERDVFRSDFFGRQDLGYAADGPGGFTLVTGAFQVRGFPLLSAPAPTTGSLDLRKTLTSTWEELSSSAQACWALGWGPEWELPASGGPPRLVLRLEPLAYWYPEAVVLDLTGAGVLPDTVKVAASRLYQTVEIGYEAWKAESANGLDEFNSTRQYTTPLTVTGNAYQAKSKLVASGTLLERTRRQRYDATATSDSGQDGQNFLVCVLPTGGSPAYETERNQRALLLDGVLSPSTVYNLPVSPGRMAQRHAEAFAAGWLPLGPAAGLRFNAGEGNVGMRSQLVGEAALVQENAPLLLTADLPAARWLPEEATLKAIPFSREQLHRLLGGPRGRIRYRSQASGGRVREGYLLDFSHKASEEQADFTLVLAP